MEKEGFSNQEAGNIYFKKLVIAVKYLSGLLNSILNVFVKYTVYFYLKNQ
jgi:hypothetical protein